MKGFNFTKNELFTDISQGFCLDFNNTFSPEMLSVAASEKSLNQIATSTNDLP